MIIDYNLRIPEIRKVAVSASNELRKKLNGFITKKIS